MKFTKLLKIKGRFLMIKNKLKFIKSTLDVIVINLFIDGFNNIDFLKKVVEIMTHGRYRCIRKTTDFKRVLA